METLQALTQYYGSYDEDNRLCSRYGMVEYLTTMRYIEKYLRPGMRILEIGAATGRYSHYFAQQGYQVDAVELVEHNIEIFKQNTKPGERSQSRKGMQRICVALVITLMISRCCWAPCTICLRRKRSCKR